MAKKNRASAQKRQREAEKRERQAKRAAKAAMKRERRFERGSSDSEAPSGEVRLDEQSTPDGPAFSSDSPPASSSPPIGPDPAAPHETGSTPSA